MKNQRRALKAPPAPKAAAPKAAIEFGDMELDAEGTLYEGGGGCGLGNSLLMNKGLRPS